MTAVLNVSAATLTVFTGMARALHRTNSRDAQGLLKQCPAALQEFSHGTMRFPVRSCASRIDNRRLESFLTQFRSCLLREREERADPEERHPLAALGDLEPSDVGVVRSRKRRSQRDSSSPRDHATSWSYAHPTGSVPSNPSTYRTNQMNRNESNARNTRAIWQIL